MDSSKTVYLAGMCSVYPETALGILIAAALFGFLISLVWPYRYEIYTPLDFFRAFKKVKPPVLLTYLSSILWLALYIALLVATKLWLEARIVEYEHGAMFVCVVITCACGLALLPRYAMIQRQRQAVAKISNANSYMLRDLALMFVASVLTTIGTEVAWNENAFTLPVQSYIFTFVVIAVLMLAFYFLGQRFGIFAALVVIVFIGFGIAEHYVVLFKDQAILPSDVLAVGTAAAVAEGYTYTITESMWVAITLGVAALGLLSFVSPRPARSQKVAFTNVCANFLCFTVVLFISVFSYNAVGVEELFGFTLDPWWPIWTYEDQGLVPGFVAALQRLKIEEPDGYSDESALETESTLAAVYDAGYGSSDERAGATAQFEEMQPCVITVMNESFSDLSIYEFMQEVGYYGPEYYNSISDALQKGSFSVSTYGGGTAITEFEYFTNCSNAYIADGSSQPYQLYGMEDVDSIAKQLSAIGYDTTAIHPQAAKNYRRDVIYQQLGFDQYLDIESFNENDPVYHNGITDATTYDKVLEILRTDSDPQFIFDLTMQNHGGYDWGTVPEEDMTSYTLGGIDETTTGNLNTYLACINHADADLAYFMQQLREIGRPVVLVFFGDHQPNFTSTMLDEYYGKMDDVTYAAYLGQTTYFIWANYDVYGNDQVSAWQTVSANELSAQVLSLIGAPLTDYQKALLATRSEIAAFSSYGVLDADATRWAIDDKTNPYYNTLNEIACMQYYNFAKKVK